MKLFFTYIKVHRLTFLLLSIIFAILNTLAYRPLVSFTFSSFLLKSLADGLILTGIGVYMLQIIPSANYVKLYPLQQFVNYFALGILIVALWAFLSFVTSYLILGSENMQEYMDMLPMTVFIGILLYAIDIQFIHYHMVIEDIKKEAETNSKIIPDKPEVINNDKQKGDDADAEVLERIAVKIGQKIHVILVPDIICIEADGDYVKIITEFGKYMKEETMKHYETSLPQSQFVRVHRSYIVNVEKILRIELYEKQNQMLTLKNGDQIRASVSGYKSLKDLLNL